MNFINKLFKKREKPTPTGFLNLFEMLEYCKLNKLKYTLKIDNNNEFILTIGKAKKEIIQEDLKDNESISNSL